MTTAPKRPVGRPKKLAKDRIAPRSVTDSVSDAVIYTGATVTQLMKLFGMDFRTVKGKIAEIKPAGERRGAMIWRVKDVAPYLVKPVGDFEAALRNMNADDLPPMLRKEFWSAKRQEQAYKLEERELWPTDEVLAAFSTAFKEMRTELLLLGEAVEREVALPERAREILKSNIDTTMANVRERLITTFGSPDPDAEPVEEADDLDADLEDLTDSDEQDDDDEFEGL